MRSRGSSPTCGRTDRHSVGVAISILRRRRRRPDDAMVRPTRVVRRARASDLGYNCHAPSPLDAGQSLLCTRNRNKFGAISRFRGKPASCAAGRHRQGALRRRNASSAWHFRIVDGEYVGLSMGRRRASRRTTRSRVVAGIGRSVTLVTGIRREAVVERRAVRYRVERHAGLRAGRQRRGGTAHDRASSLSSAPQPGYVARRAGSFSAIRSKPQRAPARRCRASPADEPGRPDPRPRRRTKPPVATRANDKHQRLESALETVSPCTCKTRTTHSVLIVGSPDAATPPDTLSFAAPRATGLYSSLPVAVRQPPCS